MDRIFIVVFNMSTTAAWLMPAILLLRWLLKKAPRWVGCLLWALIAVRLLIPVAQQSVFSLLPSANPIPVNIADVPVPEIQSGVPAVNTVINPILAETLTATVPGEASPAGVWLERCAWVWLTGVVVMLTYAAVAFFRVRRQVCACVQIEKHTYLCDDIAVPFLLGVLRPKIYIPSGFSPEEMTYILDHERAHIRRGDHFWKPLAFFLLCVHWFNPLMWVAYVLLCRDVEAACDEKVIKTTDPAYKVGYSGALLACSVGRRQILSCPLAFGEVGVRERIRTVLFYKKPGRLLLGLSVALCVAAAVCLLTNPRVCAHAYESEITHPPSCMEKGVCTYTCASCGDTRTESLPPCDHSVGQGKILFHATCEASGEAEYTCTVCGTVFQQAVEAHGHNWGKPVLVKEPNCTESGMYTTRCTLCNEEKLTEQIPPNGIHSFRTDPVQSLSCGQEGIGIRTCINCGYQEIWETEAFEHQYGKPVRREATCSEEGKVVAVCQNCGHEKRETLEKIPHIWISQGCENPVRCAVCGMQGDRRENHQFSLVKDQKETRHSVGIRTYQCEACRKERVEYYRGEHTYDPEAIQNAIGNYAREKGFQVLYLPELSGGKTFQKRVSLAAADATGAQKVVTEGEKIIDAAAAYCKKQYGSLQQWVCWTHVELAYGGEDFVIHVYAG